MGTLDHGPGYRRQQARDLRATEHRRRVVENAAGRPGKPSVRGTVA